MRQYLLGGENSTEAEKTVEASKRISNVVVEAIINVRLIEPAMQWTNRPKPILYYPRAEGPTRPH